MAPRYTDKYDDPLFDAEADAYGDYDADLLSSYGFHVEGGTEDEEYPEDDD